MKESVEILIKADDQYSRGFEDASKAMTRFSSKGKQVAGDAKNAGESFNEMGGRAKVATESVGVLATVLGGGELAGLAGQLATVSDRMREMNEVAGKGGASAIGFKLGLVGLAATAGIAVGNAIGGLIINTEKLASAFQNTKDDAAALNAEIAKMNASRHSDRREDIELIRDPEAKRQAYEQMLSELNANIAGVTSQVEKGKKEVEEWAGKWKITGDRKAFAEQASETLKLDRERLATLKDQRAEIAKILSVRADENKQLREDNAAKDRSEAYVKALREEVEYLSATREEQIKLDAARNAVGGDRGEAERLLKERDAIQAKAEAEKQLTAERERAEAERARAAEQETRRIKDATQAERDRLDLMRISITEGKEAAKARELMNRGLSDEAAKRLAAEEAALEKLQASRQSSSSTLTATDTRMLTRGSGNPQLEKLDKMAQLLAALQKLAEVGNKEAAERLAAIATNTAGTVRLKPVGG